MTNGLSRRAFLGTVTGAALVAQRLGAAGGDVASSADPRVAELVALSRDPSGRSHVARVAIVDASGVAGTLPLGEDERDELAIAMATRDFRGFEQRGLRIAGHKFVFIREDEGGRVVHAVRRGELVTVRATDGGFVIASSGPDMAHSRAVVAVQRFCAARRADA